VDRNVPNHHDQQPSGWWDVISQDAGLAVWELDLATGRVSGSHGLESFIGLAPDSFAQTLDALLSFVHREDLARCQARLGADSVVAHSQSTMRFRLVRPDGSIVHVQLSSRCAALDGQGRPTRLRCSMRDISDVVRYRDRIMAVASVVGKSHGADCLPAIARSLAAQIDAESCLVVRFRGGTSHCVAGWRNGTLGADLSWMIAGSPCEALRTGAVVVVAEGLRSIYPRWQPWSDLQPQACIAVPLCSADGQGIGGLLCTFTHPLNDDPDSLRDLLAVFSHRAEAELARQDIAADLDRAEQRLHRADKMDALGRLAGGIAHDFNNMLAGIMGAAELLDARLGLDSPHHRLVRTIIQSSERAADLTRKLLSFSRKAPVQRRQVDLRTPVEEALAILERSIDRNICVRRDFGAAPAVVAGDPGLLQAMVLNLCLNACDAMPRGGTLSVTIGPPATDATEADWGLPPGRYVQLAITDTGVGMDEETASRIFEPFFTTKAPGAGTGLGLAAAYGTIQEHAGAVRVRTAPQRGTTILVRLPLLAAQVGEHSGLHGAITRGTGRVLLVDDEEVVRQATGELLASLGWQVVHARDGEEGVRRFAENPDGFALAVLDSIMPRLDGLGCFRGMRELRPDLPVVFCSGYTRDRTRTELPGEPRVAFVQKPFRIAELVKAIQSVRQP